MKTSDPQFNNLELQEVTQHPSQSMNYETNDTSNVLDEIMALPEIQQLITMAIKSGQSLSSFCNNQYKNFNFSIKEFWTILDGLIKCGKIDYSTGVFTQVCEQNKVQGVDRDSPHITRILEKLKSILLMPSSEQKCDSLNYNDSLNYAKPLDFVAEIKPRSLKWQFVETLPDKDTKDTSDRPSLIECGKSAIDSWIDLVKNASLSVRATNILLKQCASVEELLLLSEKELLGIKNSGRKTVKEILEFQKQMLIGNFDLSLTLSPPPPPPSPLSLSDRLKLPPTKESLQLLPVFSEKKIDSIAPCELHQGFQSGTLLSDIVLSVRTRSVLESLGCKTISDVMFVSGKTLLLQKNFGRKCLHEIQNVLKKIVLLENTETFDFGSIIDFSSYASMVQSFTRYCLEKRSQELVNMRLCCQTNKLPTLEHLGEQLAITRERARQILKTGYAILKIKANLDLLKGFRESIDDIVTSGGGITSLGVLSIALQEKYKWPLPPSSVALGQLLSLLRPNQLFAGDEDLLTVECECLTCEKPFSQLLSLDFEEHESFHINVAASNLAKHCQMICVRKPVPMFHRAYIERLVRRTNGKYVIHDDLIMPWNRWLPRHGIKLEDIIVHVLERNDKPMHFSEITSVIKKENLKHWDISDHNVHAAIMRFDVIEIINRGTYGLKSWGLGGYRSVSTAIEELLDAGDRPLRRAEIIQQLDGKFAEGNITAALGTETRFVSVGEGFYDRPESWRQRTILGLIEQLPDPLAEFANFLVSNNNCSYKLVLALVFVRGMEANGSFYLPTLKERFFSFYLNRKKKGLVVEADTAIISRIGEIDGNSIRNNATKEPLKSFLSTPFFLENGSSIYLQGVLFFLLSDRPMRDLFMVIMLKSIDDYFTKLTPAVFQEVVMPTPSGIVSVDDDNAASPSISIKKKDRGKIRL